MEQLKNKMTVDVVDRNGNFVDRLQFRNVPWAELYPDKRVILIQWASERETRPTPEEMLRPILYNDRSYHGCYAWGSAVKRGVTIGIEDDFVAKDGPVTVVEDGQRVSRWLLAQGLFGGFKGKIKVGILPRGTTTPAGLIEDGFGYIKKSLVKKYANENRISLGKQRDNWTFWQRLPWSKIKDEVTELITGNITNLADPGKMLFASSAGFAQKKELVDANLDMIEHPYVALALERASSEYFARVCTTANLNGDYRTAVPTNYPTVVWPGHGGRMSIDRSPIDSNGSIQALDIEPDEHYLRESERILNMEVLQHSISAKDFSAKGCLGIVDDNLLDYDIVLCADDIKMTNSDIGIVRKKPFVEVDAVVPFLQIWDGNSTAGVNAGWAKSLMGLDHDGDGVRLCDLSELPAIWQAISELPHGETPKLIKTKTPVNGGYNRAQMISKSMYNLVGMATMVTGATYMVEDREFLAQQLGFKTEASLDKQTNYWIKVGTDGFKTQVDQMEVSSAIAAVQNNIRKIFGRTAPWTKWSKDEWAFRRGLPAVIDDMEELKSLSDQETSHAITPEMTGTCAQIARMVIPYVEPHWDEMISIRPLIQYKGWAYSSTRIERAEEIQTWFNARQARVNWSDPASILEFRTILHEFVKNDDEHVAHALWRVAHSARGSDASAASVFMAFPEICLGIVRDKPGERTDLIILTGLHYQLPGFDSGELEFHIGDVIMVKRNGRETIRKAIFGHHEDQVPPRDENLPRNLLAFVADNSEVPEDGHYTAKVWKISDKAWMATLRGVK